jgi:hypothetical protein
MIRYAVENFEELLLGSSIVMDKTSFVSDFMSNNNPNQYMFITLPRKSGKSLLMNSVSYFVENRFLLSAFNELHSVWVCFPSKYQHI